MDASVCIYVCLCVHLLPQTQRQILLVAHWLFQASGCFLCITVSKQAIYFYKAPNYSPTCQNPNLVFQELCSRLTYMIQQSHDWVYIQRHKINFQKEI